MLSYFCVTQQGDSHIKKNLPCQDYSSAVDVYVEKFQTTFVIAAISDGVGSCAYSQLGSSKAVTALLEQLSKGLENDVPEMNDEEIRKLMERSYVSAREAVEQLADEKELPFLEFDSTLTCVIYDGENLWFGHIGDDGVVVMYQDGTYEMITKRHKGETANSVMPLRCEDMWEFGKAAKPVASAVLMTDGVLDYCVDKEVMHNRVYYPFLEPAFTTVVDTEEKVKENQLDWASYMMGREPGQKPGQPRIRALVGDDITFVCLQNSDKVKALPEVQFDMKKWDEDTLRRKKEVNELLYGQQNERKTVKKASFENTNPAAPSGNTSSAVPSGNTASASPAGDTSSAVPSENTDPAVPSGKADPVPPVKNAEPTIPVGQAAPTNPAGDADPDLQGVSVFAKGTTAENADPQYAQKQPSVQPHYARIETNQESLCDSVRDAAESIANVGKQLGKKLRPCLNKLRESIAAAEKYQMNKPAEPQNEKNAAGTAPAQDQNKDEENNK